MTMPPSAFSAVHPRVCGEHWDFPSRLIDYSGSSPRLRGTRRARPSAGAWFRFIPASAGNTREFCLPLTNRTVHPRVCGEHTATPLTDPRSPGSSPRLRGTHAAEPGPAVLVRFIPASAGNTGPCRNGSRQPWVHPRVCGEHSTAFSGRLQCIGSSPRLRGTPHNAVGDMDSRGSSPRLRGTHFLHLFDFSSIF